jgi:phosphoglycolate phosphatase
MVAARAAGVTAVYVGDAAHDGGVERVGADLHFEHAQDLAARLRALAQGGAAAKM